MKQSTSSRLWGAAGVVFAALIFYIMLFGCGGSAPPPPPPPPITAVFFKWGAVNNPFPSCPVAAGPCNSEESLMDLTTNSEVMAFPPGAGSYTLSPAPAGATHSYGMLTIIANPDGSHAQSFLTLAVETQ